jgi:hypothetical protein
MPVQLALLSSAQTTRVLVGTSLRKPLPILQAYLQSLAWQELPPRVELSFAFVNDGLGQAEADFVKGWLGERGGTLLRGAPSAVADFADVGADSHQWSASAMARVAFNKNKLIKAALEGGYAALWLADSDLVMDRTTFASLWQSERPIVTAVYWTRWSRRGTETRKVHAAPQVWLRHPYELAGRGMDEAEFRRRLLARELLKVPGYGACTLIHERALRAGCSFDYLPDIPPVGLMAGEDRHFCLRAERMHIDAWADCWPDIFHCYHLPEHVEQLPAMLERLGAAHPAQAGLGDLVSLRLQPLEPVPHTPGNWTMVQPQSVRGRLGTLPLVPELEEAVFGLKRGEEVVVPVHFDIGYSIPYYRGRRRLIRAALLDCKSLQYPPIVEDELFVGPRSGRAIRTVDYSEQQLAGMKEVAVG